MGGKYRAVIAETNCACVERGEGKVMRKSVTYLKIDGVLHLQSPRRQRFCCLLKWFNQNGAFTAISLSKLFI